MVSMDICESIAERKIREAMEQGAFDDLPTKGRPLDLSENPFEDPSLRMAHRLLRNNGFAPWWVEEARDLDAAIDRLRADLRAAAPRPALIDELRGRTAALNRRIQSYNLKCPSPHLHKSPVDFDREMQGAA